MGVQEHKSRQKSRRAHLKKLILESVKIAGVVSIALLAPGVIGAMEKLGILASRRQGEYIRVAREKLLKEGLIVTDGKQLRLSKSGDAVLMRYKLMDYTLKKPRRWDEKWRMLIFDIPEKRKKIRNKVRLILKKMGFKRLQNSVWVIPYDCEDVIALLKVELGVDKELRYVIAESIDHEWLLKRDFNL